MSPIRDQLLKTATAYLDAHTNRDVEALRGLYSTSCKHENYPKPIQPIFPNVGHEEYFVAAADIIKMWESFDIHQFADPVVDEEARKVVVFVEGTGKADVGTYVNEYIVVLKMDNEGKLVEERLQFFDSKGLLDWVALLGQRAQEIHQKAMNSKKADE